MSEKISGFDPDGRGECWTCGEFEDQCLCQKCPTCLGYEDAENNDEDRCQSCSALGIIRFGMRNSIAETRTKLKSIAKKLRERYKIKCSIRLTGSRKHFIIILSGQNRKESGNWGTSWMVHARATEKELKKSEELMDYECEHLPDLI